MYCPKCGTEHKPGFTVCDDCQVGLVTDKPLILLKDKKEIKLKNHKLELISFLLGSAVLAWIVITDVLLLFRVDEKYTLIQIILLLSINLTGLTLGIISLIKKGYKNTLAVWGIVFNSITIVPGIMGILSAIIKLFGLVGIE